jgi:undecaprenyl diphosphate synthase
MWKSLEGFVKPGSEEEALVRQMDLTRLPGHVAVIMDGNGRWARKKGLPRIEGHRAGSKAVREIIEASARVGLKVLTLYTFSKENWKRPRPEVARLWQLLREYLKKEAQSLMEHGLRLRTIGQTAGIPGPTLKEIERVVEMTRSNNHMDLVLALNYGARSEIVDAVRKVLQSGLARPEDLSEDKFAGYLYTAGIPDPDLLIRTSGELRVSNFLLWQIAYTEIWITPVFWPDFRMKHLFQAIVDYQKRDRRFGDIQSGGPHPA